MKLRSLGRAAVEILACLAYRTFVTPLTWVVPRKTELWTILGRNGKVLDNSKYLACWLVTHKPKTLRVDFLCSAPPHMPADPDGVSFKKLGTWRAFWSMVTAGTVIVDDVDQILQGRAIFFRGARVVQLWHGVFLKKIELQKHRDRLRRLSRFKQTLLRLYTAIRARYPEYDLFVSTSPFYTDRVFQHGFRARRFANLGYPRNDILGPGASVDDPWIMLNTDVDTLARLRRFRAGEGRVVMYAPTFRDTYPTAFFSSALDLGKLSRYATARNLLFLIKLHPLMMNMLPDTELPGVLIADPGSDVYPLMREVDLLITDYSSICYDYLMLDRPIVFYPFDYDIYITDAQNLMFDYDAMTPGPKVRSLEALLVELDSAFSGQPDAWAERRREIRELAFGNYRFDAAETICQTLAMNHSAPRCG